MDALSANLACWLVDRAAAHPHRTALVEGVGERRRAVTYGQLAGRVAALAAGFRRRGIGAGDRVLLFVPMSIPLYETLLATLHAGATAVFVDAWADRRRLDAAIAAAHPRAFVGTPRAHLLRLVSPSIRRIPIHLLAGRGRLSIDRYARPGETSPPADVDGSAPALVTLTTGSTGRPRAAARSHDFLRAQHAALRALMGIREGDVDFPALPVFALNGLASGATVVIPELDPRRPADADPERLFAQMRAEGVTVASGSPALFERLAHWCMARDRRIAVRALFTGGAPVTPKLARLLADHVEGSVHVVYGSTEVEPVASVGARVMLDAMASVEGGAEGGRGLCAGPPVEGLEVRLVRAHDAPVELGAGGWAEWVVAPGEVGEIVAAGAHVLPGYDGDAAADRASKIHDGDRVWHRTGDAAWRDAEGRLWLMGRVSARIVRRGETIWPLPVEAVAAGLPGFTHAALVGVADAELGQRAVLCVETPMPANRLLPAFFDPLRAAVAPTPVDEIRGFTRIPRDPRHASKTDLAALRKMLEDPAAGRIRG
ncbi:MAG: acyl-CoA synthetase (AMP-forming)/AMP-acid ligase [Gemmatimonadetes bacterium]|nr:acyl-CoA synthetase (AMP-forming)/AMP-acid ligase [Gemmatimonadota bacterium]